MKKSLIGACAVLLAASCAPPSPTGTEAPDPEAARAADLAFSGDDFYGIPEPLPPGANGSLIRVNIRYRQDDGRLYRVMYRSTSVDGQTPVAVTGAIWLPPGPPPSGGFPIVAWAPMYDGVGDECAYSRNNHRGFDEVMKSLLADGFVVAVTDYEGHGTSYPFLDGIPESGAHAVLDAARAARDLLGSAASDRIIVAGHGLGGWVVSQGQNYTEAYDDGLDIRGLLVIDGGGDPVRAASGIASPEDIGVLDDLRAVRSYAAAYPELRVEDLLTPYGVQLLGTLNEEGCVPFPALEEVPVLDVSNVDAMGVRTWADRIESHSPAGAPYPALYVVGKDGSIPVDWVREVVERLCQEGGSVEFREFPATDQGSVVQTAYGTWGNWIQQRVASEEPPEGCAA